MSTKITIWVIRHQFYLAEEDITKGQLCDSLYFEDFLQNITKELQENNHIYFQEQTLFFS